MKGLLIIFSALLFLPNLFDLDINPQLPYNGRESFDPSLSRINSPEKFQQAVDSIALARHIPQHSFEYVETAESVVIKKFYHGFSHFTLQQNWIAAVCGRFVEEGIACKVRPEDILQQSHAACSQQAIVLMDLLRKKNIAYRKIGLPHHYALEVLVDNNWYFFDTNMEPVIPKEKRLATSWMHQCDSLKKYYDAKIHPNLDYQFGKGVIATAGVINEIPAQHAALFQSATAVLSKIIWCLPLLPLFFRRRFSFRFSTSFIFKRKAAPVSLAV